MADWQKLTETTEQVGYRTLVFKTYRLPDGSEAEFTTYSKIGAIDVAVIALTADRQVVIARQFRPGPEMMMDELPGGDTEPDETPADAAARELKEETGYVPGEMEYLGPVYRDAYSNVVVHYFIAYDCERQAEQALGADEFVEVATISIDELLDNARSGKLTDAAAILLAYDKLKT